MSKINSEITDYSEILAQEFGEHGTPEREKHVSEAWEDYNAQILFDARKNARLTQQQLAERIGASKGYISRIERGLTVPTLATAFKIVAAMGCTFEIVPMK